MVCGYSRSFNRKIDLTPIDTATVDLSTLAGKDLYVYGESTTPVAPYVPNITGSLNPTTGEPTITIDPATPAQMDSRLTYVITDPSGNVVAKISGADVMREGGLVTDPAIQGRKYLSCKYSSCNRCGKYSSRSTDTFKYSNSSRTFSTGYNTCSCYTYSITGSFKCGTGDDNNKSYIT